MRKGWQHWVRLTLPIFKAASVLPWWLYLLFWIQLAISLWLTFWTSMTGPLIFLPVLSYGAIFNWHRSRSKS
jgi:hypothetical protein